MSQSEMVIGIIYDLGSRAMRRVIVPGTRRDARRMRRNHLGPGEGMLVIARPADPDILAAATRAYQEWLEATPCAPQ